MSEQAISGGHGSVWDQVVGQDRAVAQLLDAAAPRPRPRLPLRRSERLDETAGGAGLRCTPHLRRRRRRPARRAADPARHAPRRPRVPTCRAVDLGRAGARDRQGVVARADRGRPQGADPRRVPPAAAGRGGADAEDDRGTATVDDVPDPLRLRAERSHHDLVALRANRLPSHWHRRDHRTPGRRRCRAGRRGHGRDRIARRHRPGAGARQRRTSSPNDGRHSPTSRTA